ncbi:MAG TPA: class I SAM-dependent RNA methyltransferase [Anaerolineales bacterium]|nr:class I SAM-dependent RNA methyltransferase [Anaerolineales bacterium]HNN14341.1 class I SAM-dependent RNA methyltransferase [Anaerolineales bacterium]HNO30463.1 class I SAM-dependent RNA methyltransferase [Anaerolineales bacterium]
MPSSQHEITLEKLSYGGEAMGRLSDGRAVFVPFGLPGETVRIRLTQEKQNFARGEILEILKPSPDRIEAKCKHFTQCGGCHYQNLPYEKQLTAKADILRDQLQRIGKIENPPVQVTVPSPNQWNYRNHVQFHLTDDGKIGFISARGNRTIPIEECHLPEATIDAFRNDLQFESRMNLERVSIRSGTDDDLMLILESETEETPELEIEADISIVHIYEDHPVIIAGSNALTIQVLGKDFHVSAPSFFQVNTPMAEKMVQHLITNLQLPITNNQSVTLLDIYCGVGLFSKFFADKYAKVIGIESAPSSCEDFAINLDEFDNVELYEGSAEEILPALAPQLTEPIHMIVDPPRAGIDKFALDAILQINPQFIAYVSCDPSTLARDAARLIKGGYTLQHATPFDLFPQTYHIESISIFTR